MLKIIYNTMKTNRVNMKNREIWAKAQLYLIF